MANSYIQSSSFIKVPLEKKDDAEEIICKVTEQLEDGDCGFAGFEATFEEDDQPGVWIRDDESIVIDHVEMLVKALVEELNLDGKHLCSWAYVCSKQRVDAFGGGAFVVQKGRPTVWVDDAASYAWDLSDHS